MNTEDLPSFNDQQKNIIIQSALRQGELKFSSRNIASVSVIDFETKI